MNGYQASVIELHRGQRRDRRRHSADPYAFRLAVDEVLLEIEEALASDGRRLPYGLRRQLADLAELIGHPFEPPLRGGLVAAHDYAMELQAHDQAERRGERWSPGWEVEE